MTAAANPDDPFGSSPDSERTQIGRPMGRPSGAPPGPAPGYPPPQQGYGAPPGYPPQQQGYGAPPGYPPPQQQPAYGAAPMPAAPFPAAAMASEVVDLSRVAANPLVVAATPLLGLVARLRHVAGGVNVEALRERVYEELRNFANAGRNAGFQPEPLRAAHYAVAATVDDLILNTPWGAHGGWSRRTMVSAFHGDVEGGERFFAWLDRMLGAPAQNKAVLEVFYHCLALGMEGRYRLHARGPAEIAKVRENLYNTLRGLEGPVERELSPRWRGENAPAKPPRAGVPVWVTAVMGIALCALGYAGYMIGLSSRADAVEARMSGLMPFEAIRLPVSARPPPPPPPPRPPVEGPLVRISRFLAPEIAARKVAVDQIGRNIRITINYADMFPPGSADIRDDLGGLLTRIGSALKTEPGTAQVLGHTDNVPIRSLRFPSNQVLSETRARNAQTVIVNALGDAQRVSARGLADSRPVAENRSAEGRARNRRIEIVLTPPQG